MIREDEILYLLYKDSWFRPNQSLYKKTLMDKKGNPMLDEDGQPLSVPVSYYRTLKNGTTVTIRISNHGTKLETWVEHNPDPAKSLQNVSIVFSNNVVQPELKTREHTYKDKKGNIVFGYRYFVVEEFAYNLSNLNLSDAKKVVDSIKNLEAFDNNSQPIYSDTLDNVPNKRATRNVLTPLKSNGKEIEQTKNYVHPRQIAVAQNPNNKVDKDGNIFEPKSKYCITEKEFKSMIKDCVKKVLRLLHVRFVGHFIAIDGEMKEGIPFGMEGRKTKLKDIRYYKDGKTIYALWKRCDNGKYCYSMLAYSAFGYDRKWTPLELSYVPTDIKNDISNAKKMADSRENKR